MKTAKQMFEELGFVENKDISGKSLNLDSGYAITFKGMLNEYELANIMFIEKEIVYSVHHIYRHGHTVPYISPKLHKAIHQQLIELGWV